MRISLVKKDDGSDRACQFVYNSLTMLSIDKDHIVIHGEDPGLVKGIFKLSEIGHVLICDQDMINVKTASKPETKSDNNPVSHYTIPDVAKQLIGYHENEETKYHQKEMVCELFYEDEQHGGVNVEVKVLRYGDMP